GHEPLLILFFDFFGGLLDVFGGEAAVAPEIPFHKLARYPVVADVNSVETNLHFKAKWTGHVNRQHIVVDMTAESRRYLDACVVNAFIAAQHVVDRLHFQHHVVDPIDGTHTGQPDGM